MQCAAATAVLELTMSIYIQTGKADAYNTPGRAFKPGKPYVAPVVRLLAQVGTCTDTGLWEACDDFMCSLSASFRVSLH